MQEIQSFPNSGGNYSNGHSQFISDVDEFVTALAPDRSPKTVPALGDGRAQATYDPAFERLIEQVLCRIGEDPQREGLQRTPYRVAKSMDFLTSGYQTSLKEVINDALFTSDSQEMVLVKDIEFYSLCEHHMLPFFGKVHIGYIPNGQIIGLSKLARVVDIFARRLQVQEQLTNQIADALVEVLNPRGVAVMSEASHFCMMMRGVQKQNSTTLTLALRGLFKGEESMRGQFIQLARTR